MAVAIDQQHRFRRSEKCKLQSLTHFEYEACQAKVASFQRSFSTPCISVTNRVEEEEECDGNPSVEIVGGHGVAGVNALVIEAAGVDPLPVPNGLTGAYFLRNKNGDKIAVVKPNAGTGTREFAAYLLDHGGFAGVPPTALVKINNKIASLQGFVDHEFDAGELGPCRFSVDSVHRIGIFDVRLLNLDRHAGNLLVKKRENYETGDAQLVPIDHGLCLPERLDDPYFEWLHWPQASVPFSETEFDYISNLDPSKDAHLLRTELPSLTESSIRFLVLCTIFLKQAAAARLSLADIGEMMTRHQNSSVLENLCAKAMASEPTIARKEEFNDFPQLLQCPTHMDTQSSPLNEENNHHKSYSLHNYTCETLSISVGEMTKPEWESFLECFEKLLPQVFVGINSMAPKLLANFEEGVSCI